MTEGVVLELDDADSYLKLLREGDSQPRAAFWGSFHHRLGQIARKLARRQRAQARLAVISRDERHGTVHLMLHAGFNSVFSSLLLLIEGYPLAAGHLMR